jgi:flavorubredoxin
MLPTMAAFLTYLSGLAPKHRKSMVFGSYGWGPKQIEDMAAIMTASGFEVITTEKIKYVPSPADLAGLRERVSAFL